MIESTTNGSLRSWSEMLRKLSRSGSSSQQMTILGNWIKNAEETDVLASLRLLSGDTPRKWFTKKALLQLHGERSIFPAWLREECHAAAPDPCEAIALMEDAGRRENGIALHEMMSAIQGAARFTPEQKASMVFQYWECLDTESLYAFNKLITGGYSINLSRNIWIPAVADALAIPHPVLAYSQNRELWNEELPLPHRFAKVSTLTEDSLSAVAGLNATWLRDAQEVQLVKKAGRVKLWSRDLDDNFDDRAELISMADHLPDGTVIHGLLDEKLHVLDVWEWAGVRPVGTTPSARKNQLADLLAAQPGLPFRMAEELSAQGFQEWKDLHRKSRLNGARGILFFPDPIPGQDTGLQWHWPAMAHRIRAVLLYAQKDDGVSGPQYSFALARGRDWVTVARTGEGLPVEDREELERFIKANTLQRFGPVRTVRAIQVMELSVDSIRASTRHKSGYLLEGVRITAWRKELGTEMADDLSILNSMKDE